jgi:uncharacterized membrane protein YbhN (UPF0104 family)
VSDLHSLLDAVRVFADHLSNVRPGLLAGGLALYVANVLLRSTAWYAILRAAYPGTRYRLHQATAAYLAGVGVNAVAPARAGDLVKASLVRLRMPESTWVTVFATLIVETLLDIVIGPLLMVFALSQGVFPSLPSLPSLPAFEWSWAADHPRATAAIGVALVLVVALVTRHAARVVRQFRDRVRQGFSILRTPRAYVLRVACPQLGGWGCRIASVYLFLGAFGVHASLRNALLVLVVGSLSTLLPLTPGGVGTQQALMVFVLAGAASDAGLLSFSVGMQVAITLTNLLLGLLALVLTLRHGSIRRAIADARAAHAAGT